MSDEVDRHTQILPQRPYTYAGPDLIQRRTNACRSMCVFYAPKLPLKNYAN